ncbi:MAG TPA: DUF2203 domain-containing protein, partial [Candidatus Eisenbacteria bacterium]|nr:DUF2203 domain-containing protein [Candidatus Eisenbacteria bacterium]
MTSGTRYFTPREAEQTLPLVRRIVEDILEAGRVIRERSLAVGSGAENDPEIVRSIERLEELFGELEELGCSYRDWNFTVGLVDFPARIDGEEVSLCWKSDEARIGFYHGEEDGFAGRKPIPPDLLGSR